MQHLWDACLIGVAVISDSNSTSQSEWCIFAHTAVSYNLSSDQRVFFRAGGEGSTIIQDNVTTIINGTSSCNTHIVYLNVSVVLSVVWVNMYIRDQCFQAWGKCECTVLLSGRLAVQVVKFHQPLGQYHRNWEMRLFTCLLRPPTWAKRPLGSV